MQKNIYLIFYFSLSFVLLLAFSCSKNRSKNNSILKDITPKSTERIPIIESTIHKSNKNISQEISDTVVLSETIFSSLVPRDYSIIGVKWANLDLDDIEEAVVVVTKKGHSFVNVLIAKFDTNSEKYFFLWQGITTIISSSFISLNIYDINNDGKKEILIEGSNENLQQHMVVFYLDDSDYSLRNYQVIFTVSGIGGGDIELQLPQDSSSSVSIVVYHIYELKEIIEKKVYTWNAGISNFTLLRNDIFSFEDQAKERVNTLNTRDSKVWLEFLNGLWIYEKNTQESSNFENKPIYALYFSKNTPELSIIKNNSMRFYQWSNRISRMFRSHIGIQVQISNLVLPDIFASLSIEVLSEKKINIFLKRDEYSETISGIFTQIGMNDILGKQYSVFSLFKQYSITSTLQQLQEWIIGNKEDSNTNSTYVFSQNTVSVFIFNSTILYKYKIFTIANNFFIELKQKDSHQFYKFINLHEVDLDDEKALFALILQPYVITSSKAYPLYNAVDIVLEKNENGN